MMFFRKRVRVCLEDSKFKVIDQFFSVWDDYLKQLEAIRACQKRKREPKASGDAADRLTQKKRPGLREIDPWQGGIKRACRSYVV